MDLLIMRYLALLIISIGVIYGTEEQVILPRSEHLNVPLSQLLSKHIDISDFDQDLHIAFGQCRAHAIGGVFDLPSNENSLDLDEKVLTDDVYCSQLRYVRHIREKYRALQTAISHQNELQSNGIHSTIETAESTVLSEMDVQTFFETYAEKRKSVVLPFTQESSIASIGLKTEEELEQFWTHCFSTTTKGPSPMRYEDPECMHVLDNVRVPLLMVHNYLMRTSVSLDPLYLPTLITVYKSAPKKVLTCPHGLHMVLLARTRVSVALHDGMFKPLEDLTTTSRSFHEVTLSADAESTDASFSLFRSDFLARIPSIAHATVNKQDLLFVPGNSFVTLETNGDAQLLRFCYVDASNMNSVKEELKVHALVDATTRTLIRTLHSSSFDTTMFRRPTFNDARWHNYIVWPKKEAKLVKRSDIESGDQVVLSRRERLKLWQDDKRWDRHVASLTLPVPLPPVILHTKRTSVSIRWQDLYQAPANDITEYGYEIQWRREDVNEGEINEGAVNITSKQLIRSSMPTTLFGDDFDGKDIEGQVFGLQADTEYSLTIRIYVGEAMGLESERSRSFRTKPCALAEPISGVLLPAQDQAPPTCVAVRWLDPIDDGGREITSYLFAMQEVTDQDPLEGLVRDNASVVTNKELVAVVNALPLSPTAIAEGTTSGITHTAAPWKTGRVCNLIPGVMFRIRIASVNAIGVSLWSVRSDPIKCASRAPSRIIANVPTLRGRGDPLYTRIPLLSELDLINVTQSLAKEADRLVAKESSERPRVMLSDFFQRVEVDSKVVETQHLQFDVWSGHFSPREFHVSSELILADPLDASTPLLNADQVKDRVVVIARGTIPFAFKVYYAQLAGALGVIIADVNGTCQQFDQRCVPGASKVNQEGFGARDRHVLWSTIRIPFVLALQDASTKILALMRNL